MFTTGRYLANHRSVSCVLVATFLWAAACGATVAQTSIHISPDTPGGLKAAVLSCPTTGTVFLGAGTYVLTERLVIGKAISLVGSGSKTCEVVCAEGDFPLGFVRKPDVLLEGITFRHTDATGLALVQANVSTLDAIDCNFLTDANVYSCLKIDGDSIVHLSQCELGLRIMQSEASQLTLVECSVRGVDQVDPLLWVEDQSILDLQRCEVTSNYAGGSLLRVDHGANVTATDCTFESNDIMHGLNRDSEERFDLRRSVVDLGDSAVASFVRCHMAQSGVDFIVRAGQNSSLTVRECDLSGGGAAVVRLCDEATALIVDTDITGGAESGIWLSDESIADLDSVRVSENGGGINLEGSSELNMSDSSVIGNMVDIFAPHQNFEGHVTGCCNTVDELWPMDAATEWPWPAGFLAGDTIPAVTVTELLLRAYIPDESFGQKVTQAKPSGHSEWVPSAAGLGSALKVAVEFELAGCVSGEGLPNNASDPNTYTSIQSMNELFPEFTARGEWTQWWWAIDTDGTVSAAALADDGNLLGELLVQAAVEGTSTRIGASLVASQRSAAENQPSWAIEGDPEYERYRELSSQPGASLSMFVELIQPTGLRSACLIQAKTHYADDVVLIEVCRWMSPHAMWIPPAGALDTSIAVKKVGEVSYFLDGECIAVEDVHEFIVRYRGLGGLVPLEVATGVSEDHIARQLDGSQTSMFRYGPPWHTCMLRLAGISSSDLVRGGGLTNEEARQVVSLSRMALALGFTFIHPDELILELLPYTGFDEGEAADIVERALQSACSKIQRL